MGLTVQSMQSMRRRWRLLGIVAVAIAIIYLCSNPSVMEPSLNLGVFPNSGNTPPHQRTFNGLVNEDGLILEDAVQELDQSQKDKKVQGKDMEHKLRVLKQKLKGKPQRQRKKN